MNEIWKEIENYEGYYEVSNLGRVKSVDRFVLDTLGRLQHRKGKLKAQTLNQDGYLTVKLSKNGVDEKIAVHILVGKAFVDGYFEGAEINHKDFDRTNNVFTNLEWVTHCDNVSYSITHGRHISSIKDYKGENNPNYQNHKLSAKYKNDKELAKIKQGRKGKANGMAKSITMVVPNGEEIKFSYIGECAEYLIQNKISRTQKINAVRTAIKKAINENRLYCGFQFIIN